MPATTSAFTACDWVIQIDGAALTLVDVSGSSSTVDLNFDNKIGEFRVFGTEWMTRVQCGKDASFKIKGIASTDAAEIKELIEQWFFESSGPRTFVLSSPSGDAANQSYTAEVLLKSFKFSGDAASADPVMYDIELVPTGEVARAIIP